MPIRNSKVTLKRKGTSYEGDRVGQVGKYLANRIKQAEKTEAVAIVTL